jgi:hypothetical protein
VRTLIAFLSIFAPIVACARDCKSPFPIVGFPAEGIHFQVVPDEKPFIIGVYQHSKLIRTFVSRKDGTFTINGLAVGNYVLFINGLRSVSFEIKPQTERSNYLPNYILGMPELKTTTIHGHKIVTPGCPSVGAASD